MNQAPGGFQGRPAPVDVEYSCAGTLSHLLFCLACSASVTDPPPPPLRRTLRLRFEQHDQGEGAGPVPRVRVQGHVQEADQAE